MFAAHPNQRAAICNSFDHRLDLGSLRTKSFFHIERDFYERAASACVLNGSCKNMFLCHFTPIN